MSVLVLAVVAVAGWGLLVLGGDLGRQGLAERPVQELPPALVGASPKPAASEPPPAEPPLSEPPLSEPLTEPPVLSLPGDFPAAGPGTFTFASTGGETLGDSGTLRRFRVAIEDGTDEDMDEFAAFVDDTLGDRRSWIGGGQVRFQRVPSGAPHDFTVYLVTGETAAQMCGAVGLDIRIDAVPYTSCRAVGQVILNLNRWRLSVPEYVENETPLESYRQMVLNHEVGHELGYGHEACPGEGALAPVMQQQTLRLTGCEPYPWPYLDGERYAGPPV